MGMLVDGKWQREDISGFVRDGKQVRFSAGFGDRISADGSTTYAAESGRYVLYFNRTCPWSHRGVVTRELKGLDHVIAAVELDPAMSMDGWWFGDTGDYRDPNLGATHLHQFYSASDDSFTGRVSIPILWDKQTGRIVNNDSGAIARMLNCEFDHLARHPEVNFFPEQLRAEIDSLNTFVGDRITDGVYRCLLAKNQRDYETGFDQLFAALDQLDQQLETSRYLLGERPTEPDWRLFACLVRFDCVYYPLYKCNKRRIADYPNLWPYCRDLYQLPGVAGTVDIEKIKYGYYRTVDQNGLIPKGPDLDFNTPHGRA